MVRYLIRLDDACPYMDTLKWQRIEDVLTKYGVKPLVGIIPANADPKTMIDEEDPLFWDKVHRWIDNGWEVALHGYDHVCRTNDGLKGLNPVWARSEYAGMPLEEQKIKMREGLAILRSHGIMPRFFFAPSHTFDENTLVALREESDIKIISDTIGRYPYKKNDFFFIPLTSGHCVRMRMSGVYVFCFHPNTMDNSAFEALSRFLESYNKYFVGFGDIDLSKYGKKHYFDKLLSMTYFLVRKFKMR